MLIRLLHSRPAPILATAVALAIGLVPPPEGWARAIWESARSLESKHAGDDASGASYYEGLLNVGDHEGARGELALRLLGKPTDWVSFHDVEATHYFDADPLLFELRPNVNRAVLGQPFTTNRFGMRDRHYERPKPEGTFRIALLGSSIDMGWGVGDEQTYENLLEDWLNAHAARRGGSRRFEVLNFAVAAYGPHQRVESFNRKALGFEPDLVLYSATMLDTKLAGLQLSKALEGRVALPDGPLRRAVADAGLPGDIALDDIGAMQRKLRPYLWGLVDDALGMLAAECRSRGLPLACVIVPRAGRSDRPDTRATGVARQRGIAARHAVPVLDLSPAFDAEDPSALAIAAWDDHPNARGHALLFRALARAIVEDDSLYRTLFQTHEQ